MVSHDTMNLAAALSASSIGVLSICGVTFGTWAGVIAGTGAPAAPPPACPGAFIWPAPKAVCSLDIAAAAAIAPEAMSLRTCTVSWAQAFHTPIDSATEDNRASKLPKAVSIFAKASRAAEASKPSC